MEIDALGTVLVEAKIENLDDLGQRWIGKSEHGGEHRIERY